MTLTPTSFFESARKKFFMNSRYIMSRKWNQTFLDSGGRNDSNTLSVRSNRREKTFH